jgi:hypothetical protein
MGPTRFHHRAATWKERKGYNTLVLVAPEELVFDSAALEAVLEPCERLEVEWL